MRTVLYYKRKNFHFSFTHQTERKRSASYLRKQMLHIVKRQWNNASSEKAFYEARLRRMKHILCLRALLVKHQNIWSTAWQRYEAKPFQASCFFALSRQKKWSTIFCILCRPDLWSAFSFLWLNLRVNFPVYSTGENPDFSHSPLCFPVTIRKFSAG